MDWNQASAVTLFSHCLPLWRAVADCLSTGGPAKQASQNKNPAFSLERKRELLSEADGVGFEPTVRY
jgi:hypothetical protein